MAKLINILMNNFEQPGDITLNEMMTQANDHGGHAAETTRCPATGKVIAALVHLPDHVAQHVCDAIENGIGKACKSYPVIYDTNGATSGTKPADQVKRKNVDLVLATNGGNLAKAGFTFAGWNTAMDGSGTDYAEGATYTANASLNLFAKWTAIAPTYLVDENFEGCTVGTQLPEWMSGLGWQNALCANAPGTKSIVAANAGENLNFCFDSVLDAYPIGTRVALEFRLWRPTGAYIMSGNDVAGADNINFQEDGTIVNDSGEISTNFTPDAWHVIRFEAPIGGSSYAMYQDGALLGTYPKVDAPGNTCGMFLRSFGSVCHLDNVKLSVFVA